MWVCLTEGGVRGKRCTFFRPDCSSWTTTMGKNGLLFFFGWADYETWDWSDESSGKGGERGREKKKKMDRGKKEKSREIGKGGEKEDRKESKEGRSEWGERARERWGEKLREIEDRDKRERRSGVPSTTKASTMSVKERGKGRLLPLFCNLSVFGGELEEMSYS